MSIIPLNFTPFQIFSLSDYRGNIAVIDLAFHGPVRPLVHELPAELRITEPDEFLDYFLGHPFSRSLRQPFNFRTECKGQ